MAKYVWSVSSVIGALALIFLLFWMNRFQYEHAGPNQVLVRVNRFTGVGCFMTGQGWNSHLAASTKENAAAKSEGYESPLQVKTDDDAKLLFGDKKLDNLMYGDHNQCQ